MSMKVMVFRDKEKDSGYQELASRLYEERNELATKLAAVATAHTLTLETSLKQAREIDRLTHQLAEANRQLGTTHPGLIEVQDQEETAST